MPVKGRSKEIKAPLARLAFAQGLTELRERDSGRKEYQCSLLYTKGTDMKPIQDIVLEAAEAAWPGKVNDLVKNELLKNPILDGDGPQGFNKKKNERLDGFAGCHFLRCSSGEEYPPKLYKRNAQLGATRAEIYSGAYVFPVIHAYAWEDDKGGKGVSFGISLVQAVKDGEKLGGDAAGGNSEGLIEAIPDEGDAPASTKTGDGAAGLFN